MHLLFAKARLVQNLRFESIGCSPGFSHAATEQRAGERYPKRVAAGLLPGSVFDVKTGTLTVFPGDVTSFQLVDAGDASGSVGVLSSEGRHQGPHGVGRETPSLLDQDENGLPSRPHHLIVARNVLKPDQVKFFLSNATQSTPVEVLLPVAISRRQIERLVQGTKTKLGKHPSIVRHLILTCAVICSPRSSGRPIGGKMRH